ncbi:unnamed protein product [Soboliphyme baturini]|uniref:EGF-like domain-containing protein n=1 Tax=Soboliphyme baturini TaxID=241478 RepID=A0A183IRU6_9BILA|nr:unnamed protein product [Soboliphyme baturini]
MKHLSETCSCGNNCPLIGSSHSEFCGCPIGTKSIEDAGLGSCVLRVLIDIGDVCVNGGSCDVSDRCDNKCQNGDCLQISGSYLCSCKPGFLGSFCEKTLDYCESFPCSPGNCTTLGKSYKCQCAENCAFVENGYESCIC